MKLPHGWQAALDRLCGSAGPFDHSCFRSVELEFAHPDKVVSGEGVRLKGGRFAAKGTRAVYGSLEDETATREVTARKARLGGGAIVSLKDYPRVTYIISIKATKCVDFREVGTAALLKDLRAAISDPDDLGASQQVGAYLVGKGVDAIIFPSVTGSGANIAVFLDADPAPEVTIANRKEIFKKLKRLGSLPSWCGSWGPSTVFSWTRGDFALRTASRNVSIRGELHIETSNAPRGSSRTKPFKPGRPR